MENTNANILVHFAQADSVLSACGMTHVAQTPLFGDVTCPECVDAVAKKMVARAAQAEGAKAGEFVASLKTRHNQDELTFQRCATRWVNSLPLNDVEFERQLHSAFVEAARIAFGKVAR